MMSVILALIYAISLGVVLGVGVMVGYCLCYADWHKHDPKSAEDKQLVLKYGFQTYQAIKRGRIAKEKAHPLDIQH